MEINGEALPVKYGLSATQKVLKLIDAKDLSQKQLAKLDALPMDKWPSFVHIGLEGGALMNDEQAPSIEDVTKAMDVGLDPYYICAQYFLLDIVPPSARDRVKQQMQGDVKTEDAEEGN